MVYASIVASYSKWLKVKELLVSIIFGVAALQDGEPTPPRICVSWVCGGRWGGAQRPPAAVSVSPTPSSMTYKDVGALTEELVHPSCCAVNDYEK